MNTLKIPCKTGQVSDGFHTFDELYEHRCTLFTALMMSHKHLSWVSTKHHDGEEWDGWFIAGMELPTGDVTYHLPSRLWSLVCDAGIPVREKGKEWDGHTAENVVERVKDWILG